MDVVRSTIEQIGGRVSLNSRVGVGTTVSSIYPRISRYRASWLSRPPDSFSEFPWRRSSETVRLPPDRISQFKNNDGFVCAIRWCRCFFGQLDELAGDRRGSVGSRACVVTEMRGRVAALEVDAVPDQLEVVLKPMQGVLPNAAAYPGTTLLGDGRSLASVGCKGDIAVSVGRNGDGNIILDGKCPVEDAEPLLELLQAAPSASLDWGRCSHIHTAVFQVVLAARPALVRDLRGCLDRTVGRLLMLDLRTFSILSAPMAVAEMSPGDCFWTVPVIIKSRPAPFWPSTNDDQRPHRRSGQRNHIAERRRDMPSKF